MTLPNPDFWRGRRVFITGHTGFKGGWLSLWLQKLGATICGYALPPPAGPSFYDISDVTNHPADIRDRSKLTETMRGFAPDIVFHLAAQALVRLSYETPLETFATNVMGTLNVLDAIRQTPGITAGLIVTSDKVYAESDAPHGHAETDPLGGRDPYSASKAAAELTVAAFPAMQTPIATLRSGNVIGGGDFAADRLLPDFFRALESQQPLHIRNPHAIRPWQHVLDPLCGYLLAAEHLTGSNPAQRPAWNFGPGPASEITVAEIAEKLCALWGPDARFTIAPPPEALHESPILRLNAAKAAAELAWQPRWNLETALARTIAWHRQHATATDMRAYTLSQIEDYCR